MEPEGSLPSLQELSTCTYPEPIVLIIYGSGTPETVLTRYLYGFP
jgi:hypothetical protein